MGADLTIGIIPLNNKIKPETAMDKCLKALEKFTDKKALLEWYEEAIGRAEDVNDFPQRLGKGPSLSTIKEAAKHVIDETFEAIIGHYRDTTSITIKGVDVYLTGGMSYGDAPSETYEVWDKFYRLPLKILQAGTMFGKI